MCRMNFMSENIFGGVTKIWEGVGSKTISEFLIYFTEHIHKFFGQIFLCGVCSMLAQTVSQNIGGTEVISEIKVQESPIPVMVKKFENNVL